MRHAQCAVVPGDSDEATGANNRGRSTYIQCS